MDWELISEQVMRHVEECLPRAPPSTAGNLDSSETSPGSDPARPVESQTTNRSHRHASDNASLSIGGRSGKCWGLACSDTGSPAIGNHPFEAGGPHKLDAIVDRLQQQALVDHALRIQKHDVGRGLAEVRAVLRRMELVESHTTARDEDMGNLAIASSKAEGMMVTLQGRQDQLDAKACDLRDILSTLERRCMCAESTLHGAVSHGQAIDVIRTILGPFREEVEKRLSYIEHELSGSKEAFTRLPRDGGNGIPAATEKVIGDVERRSEARGAQMKAWAEGVFAAESRRRDSAATAVNRQLEELARETKANTCRIHQTEEECKKLASSTSALSQRQYVIQNEENPSIRRELQDTERGLQRRIEEVRLSDARRMEEVVEDAKRERQARLEEYREVSKDVLNVKQSVMETDHRHGSTEGRICRLEDAVARDVDINLQTRKSVGSMGDILNDLRLEIQAMHGATVQVAQQMSNIDFKAPRPHSVQGAGPSSAAGIPATRSLGQTNIPPRILLPESSRFLPTSPIDGRSEMCIEASTMKRASNSIAMPMAASTKSDGAGESEARPLIPDSKPYDSPAPLEELDCRRVASRHPGPPAGSDTPSTQEESNGRDTSIFGESPVQGSEHERAVERGGVDDDKPIDDHDQVLIALPRVQEGGGTSGNVLHSEQNRNIRGQMHAGGNDPLRQAQVAESTAMLPLPSGPRLATIDDKGDAPNAGHNQQSDDECLDATNELRHPQPKEASIYPVSKISLSSLSTGKANTFGDANSVTTPLPSSRAPAVISDTSTLAHESDAGSTPKGTLKSPGSSSSYIPIVKTAASNADNRGVTTSQIGTGSSAAPDSDSSFSAEDTKAERRSSKFVNEEEANTANVNVVSLTTGVPPRVREARVGVHHAAVSTTTPLPRERKPLYGGLRRDATSQMPPASLPAAAIGARRTSTGHRGTGPAPVSSKERLGSNDTGGTSAQCEFCLRRYLCTAMASHIQICELRLVRCPYQCGAKVLVHNLEKHKNTCSLRNEAEGGAGEKGAGSHSPTPSNAFADHDSTATAKPKPDTARVPTPGDADFNTGVGDAAQTGVPRVRSVPPGGADRTVTCMRCHESLPFHLVPSHSPKCKGGGGGFPSPGAPSAHSSQAVAKALTGVSPMSSLPSSSRRLMDSSGLVGQSGASMTAAPTYHIGGGVTPLPLPPSNYAARGFPTPSPSPLSPTLGSQKARRNSVIIEGAVPTPVVGVPRSPPRSSDVRTWGTRQVTSWLRESMRPPRADVISRFHDSGIDGPALLELTDRDLLHPTEGVGITDADTRRQILKAVDALLVG